MPRGWRGEDGDGDAKGGGASRREGRSGVEGVGLEGEGGDRAEWKGGGGMELKGGGLEGEGLR